MSETPTTADIILDRVMRGSDSRRCVDWAIGLLESGRDDDYICRLAGQTSPYDDSKIHELRDRVLKELGFEEISNEELVGFAIARRLQSATGEELKIHNTLTTACNLYRTYNYDDLETLYWLALGIDSLDHYGDQNYVDDMNSENADTIRDQIINEFITRYPELE